MAIQPVAVTDNLDQGRVKLNANDVELDDRLSDVESGQHRKVLILADPPDPALVNEYIDASTMVHKVFKGSSWVSVVTNVNATNLTLAEGSLTGGAPLDSYPIGLPVLAALGTDSGWPTAENNNVLTIRPTSTKGNQIACLGAGTRTYVRRWNNSTGLWGSWAEISNP